MSNTLLRSIRVVESGGFITGPYAAMLLADMGADVIKVERPDGGDPFRSFRGGLYSPHFQAYNRNKRSITLDTRLGQDLATFDELIATSDVFIQNARPGVAEKLGLSSDRLMEANPSLIYCSISGFGKDGPYVDRPTYDTVAQAMSGFLNMFVDPNDPRVTGPALADAVTGLYAANGILAALVERSQTNKGRLIEVSMLEAMTHFAIEPYSNYFNSGKTPGPFGRAAVSQSYVLSCADMKLIALHLSSPEKFWGGLVSATGHPELATDVRFASRTNRVDNHDALRQALAKIFKAKTRDEWLKILIANDVPAAPVYDLDEALQDPQAIHLGLEITATHPSEGKVKTIRPAIQVDSVATTSFVPPPTLGEHSQSIRDELRRTNSAA